MTTTPSLVARTADGRPFIIPPEGGRPRAYTRCSTFARALDDGAALMRWKERILLNGIIKNLHLLSDVGDPMDYRGPAGALIEEFLYLGGGNDAAIFGTAAHALSEMVDFPERGNPDDHYPKPELLAWLKRYQEVTEPLGMVEAEVFVVNDRYRCAGTLDRLVRLPDGRVVVADTKAGNTLHPQQFAIQMALYAEAQRYDPETGQRSPIHPELDTGLGVVIHVPQPKNGVTAEPSLIPLDLGLGCELADLAMTVRKSRAADVAYDQTKWSELMTKEEAR